MSARSMFQTASMPLAVAGLALAMLLSSLGTSIVNVALPTLAKQFAAGVPQVQWVLLAYLLAITTTIVSVGKIGDLFGRRRLLLAGIALFTTASLFCAAAPSLPLLIAARAAQGMGAAAMMALTVALISETVPKERMGKAMGLLGTTSAIGTAAGPALGGVLIATFGWQTIFLVNLPLGLLGFYLAWRHLPSDRRPLRGTEARFDLAGTVVLAATVMAWSLATTVGTGRFGWLNVALLGGALFGMLLFVRVERRSPAPLVPLSLISEPWLSAGLALNALVATVMMTTLVVGPFYLGLGLGLGTAATGAIMSVGPIVAAVTSAPAGRLVDRFGTQRPANGALVAIASGCLLLASMPTALGSAGYVAPMILVTLGYAIFQTANNSAVMARAEASRGLASGMLNLARNLGLVTGASVMGSLFAFLSGTGGTAIVSPLAVGHGMTVTFLISAGLMMIAVAISLRSNSRERQPAKAYRPALGLSR